MSRIERAREFVVKAGGPVRGPIADKMAYIACRFAESENEWVLVGERQPEKQGHYLITTTKGTVHFAFWSSRTERWMSSDELANDWVESNTAAWRECPAPFVPTRESDPKIF